MYIFKLFNRNTIFELGIGIGSSFSGMTLNMFWKRALHLFDLLQFPFKTFKINYHHRNMETCKLCRITIVTWRPIYGAQL